MNTKNTLPIVIKDIGKELMRWTMNFFGILLVINIINMTFSFIKGHEIDHFYSSLIIAGNIYMFIAGIIGVTFLTYLVESGVSRANYFKAVLLGAVSLSIVIPIITLIIYKIQKITTSSFISYLTADHPAQLNDVVNDLGESDGLFDEMIVAIVTTPYINIDEELFLALSIFTVNLLFYYLVGWLIGTSFQHSVLFGISMTFIAAIIFVLYDSLLRAMLKVPTFPKFHFLNAYSTSIHFIFIILLFAIVIFGVRQLSKGVTVRT